MIEKRSKGGGYLCTELEGLAEGIGCKQKIYQVGNIQIQITGIARVKPNYRLNS